MFMQIIILIMIFPKNLKKEYLNLSPLWKAYKEGKKIPL